MTNDLFGILKLGLETSLGPIRYLINDCTTLGVSTISVYLSCILLAKQLLVFAAISAKIGINSSQFLN